jgi:hypothetical protein
MIRYGVGAFLKERGRSSPWRPGRCGGFLGLAKQNSSIGHCRPLRGDELVVTVSILGCVQLNQVLHLKAGPQQQAEASPVARWNSTPGSDSQLIRCSPACADMSASTTRTGHIRASPTSRTALLVAKRGIASLVTISACAPRAPARPASGRPASSWPTRSLSTWKSSTTGNAGIARWACSRAMLETCG